MTHLPKLLSKTVLLMVAILLAGCATPADPGNMIVAEHQLQKVQTGDHGFQELNLGNVTGGSETNPMWTSEVSASDFRTALRYSLQRSGYYSDDLTGEYRLDANLAELRQPIVGLGFRVTSVVDYTLTARSGETVDTQRIEASYLANMGDHIYGVERLRLANEGSIRENVRLYLEHLNRRMRNLEPNDAPADDMSTGAGM